MQTFGKTRLTLNNKGTKGNHHKLFMKFSSWPPPGSLAVFFFLSVMIGTCTGAILNPGDIVVISEINQRIIKVDPVTAIPTTLTQDNLIEFSQGCCREFGSYHLRNFCT